MADAFGSLPAKVYKWLLALPLACACLALAHVAFGLRAPMPAPAAWADFAAAGHDVVHRRLGTGASGRELSHGDLVQFDVVPRDAAKNAFSVTLVLVRKRTHADFHLATFHQHLPALAIEPAGKDDGGRSKAAAQGVALGSLQGKPALQTCITSHGVAGATQADLAAAIDNGRERGFKARWLQLMGLQPPARWECALVTIVVAPGANAYQDLLSVWAQLHAAWGVRVP